MVYLRFDQTRRTPWYLGALGLFVLGLLSKTVIATLPAALLVVFWWQRGRLSWRRDVLPLLALFRPRRGGRRVHRLGRARADRGPGRGVRADDRRTLPDRGAGDLVLFGEAILARPLALYLSALADQTRRYGGNTSFPLAALLLLALCWRLRRRWRGPLAGLLFFVGTLFPVLGFCNVYPFIFSFVADHFQYLASLGIITLVSAGAVLLLERWQPWWHPPGGYLLCLALLATLTGLTWRQSRMYADVETLFRTTIAGNPRCWMAYLHLGNLLTDRRQFDEAMAQYQKALEIRPDDARVHDNLGNILFCLGRPQEAEARYRETLEIKPDDDLACYNLGMVSAEQGRLDEAAGHYQKALED